MMRCVACGCICEKRLCPGCDAEAEARKEDILSRERRRRQIITSGGNSLRIKKIG